MKKIFFISGLGADRRAFNRVEDFDGFEKVFIDWIPNHNKETLTSYTQRLFKEILISEEDVIIGLSFGGLIASEIANSTTVNKVIFVSSFRNSLDLKPLLRFSLKLRLYVLIPNFRISFFSTIIRNWFNVTSKEGTEVLNQMVNNTSPILMKWSMSKIRTSNFKSTNSIDFYNIIGDNDRIVKLWKNERTEIIKGGGHFMVYENAIEVNGILKKIIK